MTESKKSFGEKLLKIFPNAKEQDPVRLTKKLQALELEALAKQKKARNNFITEDEYYAAFALIVREVRDILQTEKAGIKGDILHFVFKMKIENGEFFFANTNGDETLSPMM